MKSMSPAIALFVCAAALVWLPFESHEVLYATRPAGAVAAGEIGPGFELVQRIHPVTEASIDANRRQHCFAVRFATYARRNDGSLQVHWRQDRRQQQWRVAADELIDNSYRHFCPDAAFDALQPYLIEVRGMDGKPGKSATLWLVGDTRLGIARLSAGEHPPGKSLALQGSTRQRIGPAEIVRIDHGSWVVGWLCTLVIGTAALVRGFRGARETDHS